MAKPKKSAASAAVPGGSDAPSGDSAPPQLLLASDTPFLDPNPVVAPSGTVPDLLARVSSDGLLLINETGQITGINEAAYFLLGITAAPPPPNIIGQTLRKVTRLPALSKLCAAARRKNKACEADITTKGKIERNLRARALPYGPAKEVLLVLTDQTELIRLRMVRTEFVANVSHELRTPLASIRATAETLLDGAISDSEFSSRFLKTIIREADRLVRLSDDLLELSHAEAAERSRTRFDLRVLLNDVGIRLISPAKKRVVTLVLPPFPVPEEPIWIEAERSEIDQVLFNLLDNAIKYTPEEGCVTASLTIHEKKKAIIIVVEDTGIGILPQDLPRIFERFWRADRARRFQNTEEGSSGQTGGTGLGLSIVKHIVEAHGGVVRAESELGHGSRFIVRLPLPPAEKKAAKNAAAVRRRRRHNN